MSPGFKAVLLILCMVPFIIVSARMVQHAAEGYRSAMCAVVKAQGKENAACITRE